MRGRSRYPWHVWGTGALFSVFAGFCVWLVLSVIGLRADLQRNVTELVSLQRELRGTAESRPSLERAAAIDTRVRALRESSASVSATLGQRWTTLTIVVGLAVAIGFANLILLVVAHRRRERAELSERALANRYATLQQTATRLADGDLATAVEAGDRGYDDFEQALEDMRRNLVGRIEALSEANEDIRARNVEIEALAEDLRAQIRAHSSNLELRAVQDIKVADSFAPGAMFAERYRIVRPIGAGGVGDVYEIERTTDGVRLALKLLRRVLNAQHRARFAREAKLLAGLQHENVVGIHHIGVSPGGAMFLVMDLVEGQNLSQRKDRHGDAAWLAPVLARVARALEALHGCGLVHRDVKPANVVVGETPETTKLVDFGVAREVDDEDVPGATGPTGDTLAAFHTEVGLRVGTPMYMAPELGDADNPVSPSADMFAFGITAYRLLAQRAPFSTPPLDAKVLPKPRHLRELCAQLSPAAADAVMRCLAENPAVRPTAAQVAAAFEPVAATKVG